MLSPKTSRLLERPACLELRKDVAREGSSFVALSSEPWLGIDPTLQIERARFLQLSYASRNCDPPTRPILRFWLGEASYRDHILPAPVDGLGVAIIRSPRGCKDVWISPTNRPGRFEFDLVEMGRARCLDVIRRLRRSPKRLFFAVAAGWVGLEEEADLNWRWALGGEPLDAYAAWRARRHLDRELPARPTDYSGARPHFWFFVDVAGASAQEVDATCASIQGQSSDQWRVRLEGATKDLRARACGRLDGSSPIPAGRKPAPDRFRRLAARRGSRPPQRRRLFRRIFFQISVASTGLLRRDLLRLRRLETRIEARVEPNSSSLAALYRSRGLRSRGACGRSPRRHVCRPGR